MAQTNDGKNKTDQKDEPQVIEVKTSRKKEPEEDTKKSKVKEVVDLRNAVKKPSSETENVNIPQEKKESLVVENNKEEPPTSFSTLDSNNSSDNSSKDISESSREDESVKKTSENDIKDWLEDVKSDSENKSEKNKNGDGKGKKIFLFVFLFVLIAGTIAGGIYYYQTKVSSADTQSREEVVPTVTKTPSPTPTPKEEAIDPSEYSVNVLNGSGILGEASTVKDLLLIQGFENVDTANADSYDYKNTEVGLKIDAPASLFNLIKSSLGRFYVVVEAEDKLEDDSNYDVVIYVGSSKPTPTPTKTESAKKDPSI